MPIKPPERTLSDALYVTAKAAVSAVPVVGGPVAEVLAAVIVPPLERRRKNWLASIAEDIARLEKRAAFEPNQLRDSELFVSLVAETTAQALKTHQKEKLKALRNVLVNGMLQTDIAEDLKFVLLRYLEELTPTHISTLAYLACLADARVHVSSYEALYQDFSKETGITISRAHFKLCCDEIGMKKLAHLVDMPGGFDETNGSPASIPNEAHGHVVLTEVGRQFIRLVSEPEIATDEEDEQSNTVPSDPNV